MQFRLSNSQLFYSSRVGRGGRISRVRVTITVTVRVSRVTALWLVSLLAFT